MLCQLSGLPSAKLTRKINCRMVVHSFNICRGPVNSWLWDDDDVNTGLLFLEFLKSSRSQNTGLGEIDRGGPVSTGKRCPRGWCSGPGKHRLGRLASRDVCVCARATRAHARATRVLLQTLQTQRHPCQVLQGDKQSSRQQRRKERRGKMKA